VLTLREGGVMRATGIILTLLIAGLLMFVLIDDFRRTAVVGAQGHIETGARFGVEVGMPREDVTEPLSRRGLRPVENLEPEHSCHGRDYTPQHQVDVWHDDTWRRGVICVVSLGGQVTDISWVYNWMAP